MEQRNPMPLTAGNLLTSFGMASPAPAYLRNDDQLELGVISTVTPVTVRFTGYFLGPDGVVQIASWDLAAPSAYGSTYLYVTPGECLILSLTALSTGGTFYRGQVYVSASIMVPDPNYQTYPARLIGAYLTSGNVPSFPSGVQSDMLEGPGAPRVITGANPAAGAEISVTVPDNCRWRLLGMKFTLVTAAAAATRQVHIVISDGTTVVADYPAGGTQIISLTRTYYAAVFGVNNALITASEYVNLPPDIILTAGWKIATVTDAMDVGDDYGAPALYVEESVEV
jgi:hypothetical protein